MARFVGADLWTVLRALAEHPGPKQAAIAYFSEGSQINFGAGDTLIVDATERAIRSGQTSARKLLAAFRRGASVYSHDSLHAKIIVTAVGALVGSANLSANSMSLREAGALLVGADELEAVRAYIDQLRRESTLLSEVALNALSSLPAEPASRAIAAEKPSLRSALAAGLPALQDVVFGYYGGESYLTHARVAHEATRSQLPLPTGWDWYEYDNPPGFVGRVAKALRNRPVIHWSVEFGRDDRIRRFRRQDTFARNLICTLSVGKNMVTIFGPKGAATPFDLRAERKALVDSLNRGLGHASDALLGRINNSLAILAPADLGELLRLGSSA